MDNTVVTTEQGKVVIDKVEKLAKLNWGNVHRSGVLGFIDGYKSAQQKGTYSEEDVRKAVIFGQSAELTFVTDRGKEILTKEFIEKLKQEYIELETDN